MQQSKKNQLKSRPRRARASSSKILLINKYFDELLAIQAFQGMRNIIEFSIHQFSCLTIMYFRY
jgi:hypothetical protein